MLMRESLNILLYTTSPPISTIGGIEHATVTTAHLLQSHGHQVYSIHKGEAQRDLDSVFNEEYCLKPHNMVEQISDYLQTRCIDIVIIQSAFGMVKYFKRAIGDNPCKIITVYHFEPIWDKQFVNFGRFYTVYRRCKSWKSLLRLIVFPVLKLRHLLVCYMSFRRGCRLSDKIVLLAKGYIPSFLRYVGGENEEKVQVIPNAIPADIRAIDYRPTEKEKLILIVSRLDEVQKRISLALELWKEINSIAVAQGWSLVIVGDGEARLKYENYIRDHQLKNISLAGRQEPWDYYKRASIFLMTSRSEGWGITLLEAQIFGVVPVCYDTFAAAAEVMENDVSGFLIPEGNKQQYKDAVLSLMNDVAMREKMARASIKHVEKFSHVVVAKKWNDLFYSVID